MQAAILSKLNHPLILDRVNLPDKLEYGQVLVRVHFSGICGAQLNEIDGVKGPDANLPHLLGHEGGGVVEKSGPGVTRVKNGDHVVMHWRKAQGIQSPVPNYVWKGKPLHAGWVTTFNEYALVSENRMTAIPKSFDLKLATLFGCALTTGFGVIHNDANVKAGESVVVFGAGGAGMSIILAAKIRGAYPIIAVDIVDQKLTIAKKIGASHTINGRKLKPGPQITKILSGKADVVIDATGNRLIRELSYELTADKTGRTIYVGVPKKGEKISIDSFPLHFKKRISGSEGGDTKPDYDIPRLIRLYEADRLPLDHFISKVYPFIRINEAIQEVREGKVIRAVLAISK